MLKRKNRLTKIEKNKNDRIFSSPLLNIRVSDSGERNSRFGFVVSKKISQSAVVRNRTKRVLRDAVREILGNLSGGKNIIVYPKKELFPEQKKDVYLVFEELFREAGVLK